MTTAQPGNDILMDIYRRTVLINRTDEKFRSLLISGDLRLVYYPVRGQEVLTSAMMTALEADDYLVTTYRGMHDQLAKGVPLKDLWAEFTGKVTGSCKGKGGPMHITHPETGVMVTTGIVGSGLPIGNGFALSSQMSGDGRVTVVCFGDGASNIGAFHEALNMASIWKLPIIFLCQNNRYAEHTPYAFGTSAETVASRASAYGMKGVRVNGNDPAEMYTAAKEAVDRARAGEGPTLLEAMTYRMLGHVFGADFSYVPKELQEEAKRNDPVPAFRSKLLELGITEERLSSMESEIQAEIDEAVEYAKSSPYPDVKEIYVDILTEEARA